MEERPPPVWLPSLGHGAHLLAWLLHHNDWWAHLAVIQTVPPGGFGQQDTFYSWELCAHAAMVQPREGWDYTRVPRLRA
ncbi:hypothetical protein Ssi03_50710 [Sphaerisporangium siamense]|uniref:Uncharacterized protein n=1 Tax=Sphaerisporangium siamense TaxID=795645 RepID=A0A7W7D8F7_9ACTN|nr:hypothetical protein [Sphaerisporangium siamense]MBB4702225.1 hypothetical protein [Sphaerisporangium siamense]GII87081.1 hypothetical protein Ssi03_50710 [Sphaerisporangium siamense]